MYLPPKSAIEHHWPSRIYLQPFSVTVLLQDFNMHHRVGLLTHTHTWKRGIHRHPCPSDRMTMRYLPATCWSADSGKTRVKSHRMSQWHFWQCESCAFDSYIVLENRIQFWVSVHCACDSSHHTRQLGPIVTCKGKPTSPGGNSHQWVKPEDNGPHQYRNGLQFTNVFSARVPPHGLIASQCETDAGLGFDVGMRGKGPVSHLQHSLLLLARALGLQIIGMSVQGIWYMWTGACVRISHAQKSLPCISPYR